MNSLEFTAKIEHGFIHLPKEFEDYENSVAHVVITIEMPEEIKEKKEKLFAVLKKCRKRICFEILKTLSNGREN